LSSCCQPPIKCHQRWLLLSAISPIGVGHVRFPIHASTFDSDCQLLLSKRSTFRLGTAGLSGWLHFPASRSPAPFTLCSLAPFLTSVSLVQGRADSKPPFLDACFPIAPLWPGFAAHPSSDCSDAAPAAVPEHCHNVQGRFG
jgi:hypothetical protein